jgi:chromosome partitioning protein
MIVSVVNQKGGVGKTTTTQTLANALSQKGQKVLAIDLDPQGSLGILEGIPLEKLELTMSDVMLEDNIGLEDILLETSGYDLAPSRIDLAGAENVLGNEMAREYILKEELKKIKEQYDYILIDCPPNLNLLTMNALAASDKVAVVTESSFLSVMALDLLTNTVEKIQKKVNPSLDYLGIIITKIDKRTSHSIESTEHLHSKFDDISVFDVPIAVAIQNAPMESMSPVTVTNPKHKVSKAYFKIAEAMVNGVGE